MAGAPPIGCCICRCKRARRSEHDATQHSASETCSASRARARAGRPAGRAHDQAPHAHRRPTRAGALESRTHRRRRAGACPCRRRSARAPSVAATTLPQRPVQTRVRECGCATQQRRVLRTVIAPAHHPPRLTPTHKCKAAAWLAFAATSRASAVEAQARAGVRGNLGSTLAAAVHVRERARAQRAGGHQSQAPGAKAKHGAATHGAGAGLREGAGEERGALRPDERRPMAGSG